MSNTGFAPIKGYDFQFLWTTFAALELIRPGTDLSLVAPEGISEDDHKLFTGKIDDFVGIDYSEYFGGNSFILAKSITFNQVKLGVVRPNEPWTVAKLTEKKNANIKASSVIGKQGIAFKKLLVKIPIEEIIEKLEIRIISNRPLAEGTQKLIFRAKEFIQGKIQAGKKPSYAAILKGCAFSKSEILNFEKLWEASTLNKGKFYAFLSCISIGYFNLEGPAFLTNKIYTKLLSEYNTPPSNCFNNLKGLIEESSAKQRIITKQDVLSALGVHEPDIFPALNNIAPPVDPIYSNSFTSLVTFLNESNSNIIITHGNAGMGKTTALNLLKHGDHLGNYVFVYDCYNNDQGPTSFEARGSSKVFFTQLNNELSTAFKIKSIILTPYQELRKTLHTFYENLKLAADIANQDKEKIYICIDAVDNVALRYDEDREKGERYDFLLDSLKELIKRDIPDNIVFILSCRTERRQLLSQFPKAAQFGLKPFLPDESIQHLQSQFSDLSPSFARRFHEITSGIPRLQYYILQEWKTKLGADARYKPDLSQLAQHESLEKYFEECWFSDPTISVEERGLAVACLSQLEKFLPISVLAGIMNLPDEQCQDILKGFHPGIDIRDQKISFRDEDYGAFIQKKFEDFSKPSQDGFLLRITDFLFENIENDPFACRFAPTFLFQAKRYRDVLEVAYQGTGLPQIANAVERNNLSISRFKKGYLAALELNCDVNLVQSLFSLAFQKKKFRAVRSAILSNTQLALVHGHAQSLQSIAYAPKGNKKNIPYFSFPADLMQQRWINEGDEKFRVDFSTEYFEDCRLWFSNHDVDQELKTQEDYNRLVYIVIYLILTNNFKEVRNFFVGWQKWFQWDLFKRLCSKLPLYLLDKDLLNFKSKLHNSLYKATFITHCTLNAIHITDTAELREICQKLPRLLGKIEVDTTKKILKLLMDFIEIAFRNKVEPELIKGVVTALPLPSSLRNYTLSGPSQWGELHTSIMQLALIKVFNQSELKIAAFTKELFEPTKDIFQLDTSLEKEIEIMLPAYNLWAKSIIYKLDFGATAKAFKDYITTNKQEVRGYQNYNGALDMDYYLKLAISSLFTCESIDLKGFVDILDITKFQYKNPIYALFSCVEQLLRFEGTTDLIYEIIESKLEIYCNQDSDSLSDSIDNCIRISNLYLKLNDQGNSKKWYTKSQDFNEQADEAWPDFFRPVANVAVKIAPLLDQDHQITLNQNLEESFTYLIKKTHDDRRTPREDFLNAVAALSPQKAIQQFFELDQGDEVTALFDLDSLLEGMIDSIHFNEFQRFSLLKGVVPQNISLPQLKSISTAICEVHPHLKEEIVYKTKHLIEQKVSVEEKNVSMNELEAFEMDYSLFEDDTKILQPTKEFVGLLSVFSKQNQHAYVEEKYELIAWYKLITKEDQYSLKGLVSCLHAEKSYNYTKLVIEQIHFLFDKQVGNGKILFLDRLIEAASILKETDVDRILQIIIDILLQSSQKESIVQWFSKNLQNFVPLSLPNAVNKYYGYEDRLDRLIEQYQNKIPNFKNILLQIIHDRLDKFSFEEICLIPQRLSSILSSNEVSEGLSWALQTYCHLDTLKGDSVPKVEDSKETLCSLVSELLGHPDNRTKWRGIYIARELIHFEAHIFLPLLVQKSFDKDHPYWMSQRRWILFLLLHCITRHVELPLKALIPLKKHIIGSQFPHAGNQELVKQIFNVAKDRYKELLTDEEWHEVEKTNNCIKIIPRNIKDRSRESHGIFKFPFDHMDTFPYWYSPLAHCFSRHRCDVAEIAENWLTRKWKITESMLHHNNNYGDSWQLHMHRHGSMPTIEGVQTYYEYHAMHLAAGEMVRSLPAVDDEYSNLTRWDNWIKRHCFEADPFITSDILSLPPVLPHLKDLVQSKEKWLRIQESDFDILKKFIFQDNSTICQTDLSAKFDKKSFYLDIESTLAPQHLSQKYLEVFQTMPQDIHHFFPKKQSNHDDLFTVDDDIFKANDDTSDYFNEYGEFQIEALTGEVYTEQEHHSNDPHWDQLSRKWLLPVFEFTSNFKISVQPDSITGRNNQGDIGFQSKVWSTTGSPNSTAREYGVFWYEGSQVTISNQEIQSYLKVKGMDLIVKAMIRKNNGSYENEIVGTRYFRITHEGMI